MIHLTTRGFDAFARGTFGNAGQNLYVSRGGVLQRIFQFDVNRNGYVDLVFCNSQNHYEQAPAYVYRDPLGGGASSADRVELPAEGARSGAVADLTGDGYDDVIVGNYYGGVTRHPNSTIYFGSADGWSERYRLDLPAPMCVSVAAGDFNSDGRIDLAFLLEDRLRMFYQTAVGFEPKRFVDLEVQALQLAATDAGDLVARLKTGEVRVYRRGGEGIDPGVFDVVPVEVDAQADVSDDDAKYTEYVADATPLVKVIDLSGAPHLYVARQEAAWFVPIMHDARVFGEPIMIACRQSLSVAVGDVAGKGVCDLVFACRDERDGGECSWVYFGDAHDGGAATYDDQRRTRLPTDRACDVALTDLDGDGRDEIVICQNQTRDSFTTQTLIFRAGPDGVEDEPVRLESHDARRVLAARSPDGGPPQVLVINHFSRRVAGDVDIAIYHGGPDGFDTARKTGLPGFGAVEALVCDLDDNGFVDVILANCAENAVARDPGSYVYLGGKDGFGRQPSVVLPTVHAHGVCCADLNRDGYLDLVFCGFDNADLFIFYGSASGFDCNHFERVRMEYDGVVYDDPRWIYLADLSNNGYLDLVVPQIGYDRSFVLWGGPDGFSMKRCQALSVFHGVSARAADLSGNGYLDLVIAGHTPSEARPHDTFVHIYWNGPDGLRENRKTLLPARGANAMALADFNNDGLLDLFVCSYHDVTQRDIDSYIYWNRPGRGFAAADRRRMFMHSASGCVAADFNDDGHIDLAVAYHKVDGDHVGHSAVWWNGPDGFDEKRVTTLPTTGPHGMTCIEPGNIMDRGPEEFYTSEPVKLPDSATPLRIGWDADIPSRTWVNMQFRTAQTCEALEDAPWTGPTGPDSRYENEQPIAAGTAPGNWLQYRLALGADKAMRTPRITHVTVTCTAEAGRE